MKRMLGFIIGLATFVTASAVSAQSYPDRPVKVIVPFAPAGPTDVIARIVADRLSANLGKQFYVENRAGAGGNTGTAAVAQSPADGYTLLVASTGLVVNPSLFAKVPYDPVKDFAPISLIAVSPNVLTVHPSVAAKTVKELVDATMIFVYFGAFSLWSFASKLYRYGHELAPAAPVKVEPFMPPVFGYQQIANFEVYSYPKAGSYLLFGVPFLLAVALVLVWRQRRSAAP